MSAAVASNGSTELSYETFGTASDPTLLLVCGLGMQSIGYDDGLVDEFVGRGFHVVRYDNRDSGLSSDFAAAPTGHRGEAYRLADMAADGIAVLDAAGVTQAHVFGISMGGMIVQRMAIHHPERLLTMTTVMSSTGEREVGQATPEASAALTARPPAERAAAIAAGVEASKVWASPAYLDVERLARASAAAYDRAFRPDGIARQLAAILADGRSRAEPLRSVTVPTLVIHGTADTLIDVSGGRRTAELIPGAQLEIIEGMGHDLPPQLWGRIAALVADFVAAHSG